MLRIMTMNINYYVDRYGEWDQRKQLIKQAIEKHEPHIIALQAVRQEPERYDGLDQAAQLSQLLPDYPHVVFQPAQTFQDRSANGSAFLSRFRILETDFQPLTFLEGLDDPNQRIVLHGLFDLPECPLHVFNSHFSWVADQSEKNINEALQYATCFKGYKLLLGDLNTNAGSALFQPFREEHWVDAWEEKGGSEPGYTYDSRSPSQRIDYLWIDQELKDRLANIEIIATEPGSNDTRASDHFGLLASFEHW